MTTTNDDVLSEAEIAAAPSWDMRYLLASWRTSVAHSEDDPANYPNSYSVEVGALRAVLIHMDDLTARLRAVEERERELRQRITTYAKRCADIEGYYHTTEWSPDQVIDATMESRIMEVGWMARDDLAAGDHGDEGGEG